MKTTYIFNVLDLNQVLNNFKPDRVTNMTLTPVIATTLLLVDFVASWHKFINFFILKNTNCHSKI